MPISIILLGVFIIFINFKIGNSLIKQLPISAYTLDIVCLLAFLLLCVKPIVLWERVYVSLGGFFVLSALALYFLLLQKTKLEVKRFVSSLLTFLIVAFLLQLIVPYLQMDIFDNVFILLSAVIGVFIYFSSKNLSTAYSTIFIGFPLLSITWFLLKEISMPYEVLLLGTGNLFEMSAICMLTVFLLDAIKETFITLKLKNKPFFIKHKKEIKNEV